MSVRAHRLSALKPPPERLNAPPVHAEVVDGEPRCGTDVDHAARGAETKLDVIDEPESGPADRMEIVVRCREDNRARQPGEESLQPVEDDGGVP